MKNYLYLVALAGMIFTGCVKTDVATPEQKDIVIGFQSPVMYSNMDTKAGYYGEIGENTYLVDGSTNLDDFLDEVDLDLETESGTLAGYVMEKFGGLPEEGQTYTDENMSITVREMDVQRIISAEITVFHKDDEDEDEKDEEKSEERKENESDN